MKKTLKGIHNYISDWKNLLTHTITGIVMLLIIFVLPLPSYIRLIVFIGVVVFNLYRGKLEKSNPKIIKRKRSH